MVTLHQPQGAPKKLYFLRGAGSVKRRWSSRPSFLHNGASGPASMSSTILLRWDIKLWTFVPGSAACKEIGVAGTGAGPLCEELAPSDALDASSPGGALCVAVSVAGHGAL